MLIPSAIVFVNDDLNNELANTIANQLQITETISDQEFADRVAADPNYPQVVHLQRYRVLVILHDWQDPRNIKQYADVVIFVKGGLASVEKNNFGAHTFTTQVQYFNIYELLRANNSPNVITLPPNCFPQPFRCCEGVFGFDHRNCKCQDSYYKWIPTNQPNRPPFDPEEGE